MVDTDTDLVAYATGRDIHPALLGAAEDIGQRPETFERIAKLPPTGRDIIRLIADPHGVIEALFQRAEG
jgi:hypothetical protein